MRKFTNLKIYLLGMLFMVVGGSAFGQTTAITGEVLHAEGEPLPGATILEQGTTNGSVTDMNGANLTDVSG